MNRTTHLALGIAIGAGVTAAALSGSRGTVAISPAAIIAPLLPDPKLTPGATLPVTTAQVCVPSYSKGVRDVTQAEKDAVYAEYGIKSHKAGEYEVDHLISLELGGSNDIRNLWPESYRTEPWNAHVKDRYEDWLHAQVCAARVTLADAQDRISHDWISHYRADLGEPSPEAEGGKK